MKMGKKRGRKKIRTKSCAWCGLEVESRVGDEAKRKQEQKRKKERKEKKTRERRRLCFSVCACLCFGCFAEWEKCLES